MSMIKYPIDGLREKCGTSYALAVVTAKRAKELLQGQRPLVEVEPGDKVISVAAKEIYNNKIFPVFDE